jgi:integrase
MTNLTTLPPASLVIREHNGEPFYEAKFRIAGHQVKRRVGRAWLTRDASGNWVARAGRVAAGCFDERRAHVRAAEIVASYVARVAEVEREELDRRSAPATFRDVAAAYLDWLERVRGAKPATLRQHRCDLAEPGVRYRRGSGETAGRVMRAIGDRPAHLVTTEEIDALLESVADSGVSARTVNRVRDVVRTVFNFGMSSRQFRLSANPATRTDRRRTPEPGVLVFYVPEEIEAIARALVEGRHRDAPLARAADDVALDQQTAEAVRVAAFSGLRLGELLALRWRDVDWPRSALTISRAVSAGVEGSTKSGRVRQVPMADQAAAALERLSRRGEFVRADDYVFCNAYGRRLDDSALRRRYKAARDAIGMRPLRWHDLRHTFGSLLVAGGVDLVSVKDAMGHAELATTSRYLHARPASERAAIFTEAFAASTAAEPLQATPSPA